MHLGLSFWFRPTTFKHQSTESRLTKKSHNFSSQFFFVLRFFGKYPAMDVRPLLLECHGSEIIFDWSSSF